MLKKCLIFIVLTCSVHAAFLKCAEPANFINEHPTDTQKPKIASNSKGAAALLFSKENLDNNERSFFVSFKSSEEPWTEPQRLGSAFRNNHYQVVMDETGMASFHWIEHKKGKDAIYYGQKTSDEIWSAPFCLDYKGKSVAMLDNGTLVSHGTNDDFGEFIETTKPIATQFFNLASSDTNNPSAMTLAINIEGQGFGLAMQSDWMANTTSIKACWYNNGQWSPPQLLYQGPCRSYDYRNMTGYQGRDLAVVKWEDDNGINIMTITGEEKSSVHLDRVWGYKFALSPNDDIFVVYQDGNRKFLQASYKEAGQEWMHTCVPLPRTGSINIKDIKSDRQGNMVVIWTERFKCLQNFRNVYRSVICGAFFSTKTRAWSNPVLLSSSNFSCIKPSLALSGEGRGWVSWIVSNGYDNGIQVAELTYGD